MFPIRNLKIENYKSIDVLDLDGLRPFSVFAGANGTGKSNFFDAMEFVSGILRFDVPFALRMHGGYANVRSSKRYSPKNQRFGFRIEGNLSGSGTNHEAPTPSKYRIVIHDFHRSPRIEEHFDDGSGQSLSRPKTGPMTIVMNGESREFSGFSEADSALLFMRHLPLTRLLTNMTVYRVDPGQAKEPDRLDIDPTALRDSGSNLASVLQRLENDNSIREVILDWMETIVPSIEKIQTVRQNIDRTTTVLFKERGTRKRFPAGLMSDGTMYALCMLVAVLDRRNPVGVTMIEEPERGLHPSAISELVGFFREHASPSNPIWLTTHSEAVVRQLRLEELILVDKEGGRTQMKRADSGNLRQKDLSALGLDKAWLSNLLAGGVPW